MKQIQHLAPLHGLNPVNVAEEAGLEGTWMRGGYNVEVIDGEWWVRHGLGQLDAGNSLGTVLWRWVVSSRAVTERMYLVAPNYVVYVEQRFAEPGFPTTNLLGTYSVPYPEGATVTANYTQGSVSVHSTAVVGAIKLGQLIIRTEVGPVGKSIYRVTAIAGADFQLDRPWETASEVGSVYKFYDPLLLQAKVVSGLNQDTDGGCVLFEQTASFTAAQLGWAHPAVSAGTYIIISSQLGYVACPAYGVTVGQVPVTTFVRETQLAAPTAVSLMPVRPGEYKDRAFMKAADGRTVWYSRPFDFMQWHTGLQALGGTPNFITLSDPSDPITGFGNLNDTLIVHRRSSQDIFQPYGTGFRTTHSPTGIGFWPYSQFVEMPLGHFGWTRYGPALYNGEGMNVLIPQLERMLVPFLQSQRASVKVRAIVHDENRRRLYCLLGWETIEAATATSDTRRIIRQQDAASLVPQTKVTNFDTLEWYSRSPVLVVDYARNEAWLEDHVGLCGGGTHLGQAYFFRYDGTVAPHPTGWSGMDYDVNRVNAKHPLYAQVETQWLALGTPQRKDLQKIYILLRGLDSLEDVDEILGGHFNPLRIDDLWASATDTLHLCTVEVMVDRTDDIRATADVTVSTSEMLARALEGNRMLPVFAIAITPRCAGLSFKFRFRNQMSQASIDAGYKQGSFRLVDMLLEYEVEADTRAVGLIGGRP